MNTTKLEKFRTLIIFLAIVSSLLYPLLEIVATSIDVRTGKDTTTNGAGWVPFHPISELSMYIFVFGLVAAVGLSFIYMLIRIWAASRSKWGVTFVFLIGVIVTSFAFMLFMILLMLIGGLIHDGLF
jgi:hypothetical protein